ncbi:hypothetical protein O6H91_10G091400 [Diphasiastrum complanatum]|uniref:Uncharacterized protein n=1 Tax=Diphasiastrum complanatum TaxID=34168 RepID=A0ACC2CJI5_DIPCM|nr:hypothetical protein O6H91_10G091400 [Diphasiastrum complanatum]
MEFRPDQLTVFGKEFLLGALGGMVGVIAGHPLDTIRIHLQWPSASGPTTAGAVGHLLSSKGCLRLFPLSLFKSILSTISSLNDQAFALPLLRILASCCKEQLIDISCAFFHIQGCFSD